MKFKDVKIGQKFYYHREYTKVNDDYAEGQYYFGPNLDVYGIKKFKELDPQDTFRLGDLWYVKISEYSASERDAFRPEPVDPELEVLVQ